MANYSLTVNSKFRPFSYAEMVAPVQAMTQAHQAIEDKYAELMSKASVWENMANEQRDPKAYAMYKYYSSQLMLAADELSRNGLTAQSRPQLMALAAGYSKYIDPIEKAYEARAKDIERQQALMDSTGDRTVFTNYADQSSLDSYLYGNKPRYHSANLDTIRDEGIAGGKAISERVFKTEEKTAFDKAFFNLVETTGIDLTDKDGVRRTVETLINSGEFPELKEYWDNMLSKSRAVKGSSPYSEEDRQRIEDALKQGISLGIVHNTKNNIVENWPLRLKKEQDFEASENAKNRQLQRDLKQMDIEAEKEARKPMELNVNGTPVKVYPNGIITDSNNNIVSAGSANGNNALGITDGGSESPLKKAANNIINLGAAGYPLNTPILTDNSPWLPGWSDAVYPGEDKSGFANWWNSTAGWRDWGADAKDPSKISFNSKESDTEAKVVSWNDIPREAQQNIIKRATTEAGKYNINQFTFPVENYNFYYLEDKKNTLGGVDKAYIAIPKSNDSFIQKVDDTRHYKDYTKKRLLEEHYIDESGNTLKSFDVYEGPSTELGKNTQIIVPINN